MSDKNERIYIGFLICLTVIITLIPFFNIGFTSSDDLEFYLTCLKDDVWADAHRYAQSQGRFYFLIMKPFYALSYLFDNFCFTKIVQHGSLILSYSLFSWLVYKMFKSKALSGIVLLFLVMNTIVTFDLHIPFIAYPAFFTFSFSLCIISLLLFIKYTETQKYRYVLFSAALFFLVTLFYETYLIILSFICLYILIRNLKRKDRAKIYRDKVFYKEIVPFIVVGFLYVSLYFLYRYAIVKSLGPDSFYAGCSFAKDFSLKNFFMVLKGFTKINFPLQSYLYYQGECSFNSVLIEGHKNNIGYVLMHAQPVAYINALVQCFIFVYFTKKMENTIPWKTIIFGILFSLLAAYSIHTLIGISEKYNAEYYNLRGYVTSYYSYFGIMLFIAFLFYALLKIVYKIKIVRQIATVVCTCLVFGVSIITNYTNDNLSKEWVRSQNRFKVIDCLAKQNAFDQIPENAIVYTEDLHYSHDWGKCLDKHNMKMEIYLAEKTKANVNFINNPASLATIVAEKPQLPIYLIDKKETIKNTEVLLTIAKVDKNSILFGQEKPFEQATCREASVYYYSPTKDFTLLLDFAERDSIREVLVNVDTVRLENNDRIAIRSRRKNNPITTAHIKSDQAMYATRFSVSNMVPDVSPGVCLWH